jgi:hypothetical protein
MHAQDELGNLDGERVARLGTQYWLTTRLLDYVVQMRIRLGGDLERYYILLAFQVANLANQVREHGPEARTRPASQAALTALSISDMTGIPRETVRRKLKILEHLGYVRADAKGNYRLTTLPQDLDLIGKLVKYIGYLEKQPAAAAGPSRSAPDEPQIGEPRSISPNWASL